MSAASQAFTAAVCSSTRRLTDFASALAGMAATAAIAAAAASGRPFLCPSWGAWCGQRARTLQRRRRALRCEHRAERGGGHRAREEIALGAAVAQVAERVALILRPDALGHHVELERVGHRPD